jgi:hypothetical protein
LAAAACDTQQTTTLVCILLDGTILRREKARVRRFPQLRLLAVTCCLLLALATGCARPAIVFEPTERVYDSAAARNLLTATAISGVSGHDSADAPGLRHEALVSLRSMGVEAESAAELITRVFPPATRAVPIRVEAARWGETPALVLIEAYGRSSGKLDQKRIWVLERSTGAVLFTAASR